jgi:hypothetical protein
LISEKLKVEWCLSEAGEDGKEEQGMGKGTVGPVCSYIGEECSCQLLYSGVTIHKDNVLHNLNNKYRKGQ